jgi:hypothetical protein
VHLIRAPPDQHWQRSAFAADLKQPLHEARFVALPADPLQPIQDRAVNSFGHGRLRREWRIAPYMAESVRTTLFEPPTSLLISPSTDGWTIASWEWGDEKTE